VGDLARLAIKLQLAKGVDGRTLWSRSPLGRQRHGSQVGAEKRVEDVAEGRHREDGSDQERGQLSRLTAASRAASSLSVASTWLTGATGNGARERQRRRRTLTRTAPAPSATNGIV